MINRLFKMGITTLFAGGYMVFDVMTTFFTNELLVVKTYGSQLSLMLTVYFAGMMVCDSLKDKYKKIAEIVMYGLGIMNLLMIVLAASGKVLLYDTLFYWELAQGIISMALIAVCALELKRVKKYRVEWILYICMNIAIFIDTAAIDYNRYYSGICFKVVYTIILILFLGHGVNQVILDHQASIKNKNLREELEKSRITVMLSQIQPHFLYNSLTCVMDLCDSNPKLAKAAIADFADYLRGNLASLKTENLISFRAELEHIEKYLRLEKLRFRDELEVIYDINTQDFMLPALSVQPLIENAVKHGVGQKIGGGTVTIQTFELEDNYLIRITDDGIGFNVGEYVDDSGTHVGIENIKNRLKMMANAQLKIENTRGEGTIASILIPKRRD